MVEVTVWNWHPAKVERRPRSGVVNAVRGPMVTVRWDTGEQSTAVPAGGSRSVLGHKAKSTGQTAKQATKNAAAVAKRAAGETASATDKAASRVAKAVERRSDKAVEGRSAEAAETSASKAEKAVDRPHIQGGRDPRIAEASEVTEQAVAGHPWAAPA